MLYDIIIIGGGISGLYTAYHLKKENAHLKILLLEKLDYLGGRVYTYSDKTMPNVEAGAGRLSTKHKLTLNLIDELHLKPKIVPISSDIGYAIGNGEIYHDKQHAIYVPIIKKIYKASKRVTKHELVSMSYLDFAKKVVGNDLATTIYKTFGFTIELTTMNAYDAIKIIGTFLPSNNHFLGLKGGMSQIIDKLHIYLKNRIDIRMSRSVVDIINRKQYWSIVTNMHNDPQQVHVYYGKICISTLPAPILKQIPLFHQKRELFDQIICGSLCRIYCKFPTNLSYKWFEKLDKFTCDNDLRMVIPIDLRHGIIMASYSDGPVADRWKTTFEIGGISAVNERLKSLYREIGFEIGDPLETRVFYWACGVGYWTIGADSKSTSHQIQNLAENKQFHNFYVCGENYSETNQQWIEGALETAEYVLEKIDPKKI